MAYSYGTVPDCQSRRAILENGQQSSLILYLDPRQFASPIADGGIGHWTTQSGGTTNLYASVDETLPDDTDYIKSYFSNVADPVTLTLGAVQAPLAGPRYLRYRYGKDAAGGRRVDLTVELMQGASSLQTWNHQDIPPGFVEVAQLITAGVSDYGSLGTRFTYQEV